MHASRRSSRNLTSHARHNNEDSNLDVTLLPDACDVSDLLVQYQWSVLDMMSLPPGAFLAQTLLRTVAGIYVYPSSAPLHVAHRRLGSRTQSRVEVTPGRCLLRGESARHNWTLAIPPLLVSAGNRRHDTTRQWSERTRKIALLSDHATHERDLVELSYTIQVHRPREP